MGVPVLEPNLTVPAKSLPPWQWRLIKRDTSFIEVTKHAPEAHVRMHFLEIQSKYSCIELYTDASKSHAGAFYATIGPSFSESDFLHPETTIFTAEAYALLSAVKHKEIKTPQYGYIYRLIKRRESLNVTA